MFWRKLERKSPRKRRFGNNSTSAENYADSIYIWESIAFIKMRLDSQTSFIQELLRSGNNFGLNSCVFALFSRKSKKILIKR